MPYFPKTAMAGMHEHVERRGRVLSRVGSSNRYSTCMEQMENVLTNNSDLVSIVSHEIDIGSGHYVQRHMIMAMVDGIEISVDPLDANT